MLVFKLNVIHRKNLLSILLVQNSRHVKLNTLFILRQSVSNRRILVQQLSLTTPPVLDWQFKTKTCLYSCNFVIKQNIDIYIECHCWLMTYCSLVAILGLLSIFHRALLTFIIKMHSFGLCFMTLILKVLVGKGFYTSVLEVFEFKKKL